MAIVKLQPDAQPAINVTVPQAIQEPDGSIFTSLIPESRVASLLKYVEGYPWTVSYYGQILNKNNTLENFDPATPSLTQPYYEISQLILQVSSPLTSSYDQTTGVTSISGEAIVPYSITPNVGDIFIASVDSGEDAIFLINTVSRKTYRKDTVYEISYNLFSYTSSDPLFITNLKQRIQDTYYFNKDTNFFNRDVLIKPTVKEAIDRLKIYLKETQEYYFYTFAQKEAGTILIPGISKKVYDPLLLNFISKIVESSTLVDTPFFRHNYSNNRYIDQPSFFDLLINRNMSLANSINKRYSFVNSAFMPNSARLGTIFHTGVSYTLFPVSPNTNTDIDTVVITPPTEFMSDIKSSRNYFIPDIQIQTKNNDNVYTIQLLHEMFINDYYVVSENFYNYVNNKYNYSSVSFIELLIYKHINKEAISKEDLVLAIQSYMQWSLMSQIYILPVLWNIINCNIH